MSKRSLFWMWLAIVTCNVLVAVNWAVDDHWIAAMIQLSVGLVCGMWAGRFA